VLLATVPGEPHGLGLLMVHTMLVLEHCSCLSLGVQVPTADVAAAAAAWRADIVALSFTACLKRNRVLASLANLRAQMPQEVQFWVGGAAPALRLRQPAGVVSVLELDAIPDALQGWRQRTGRTDARHIPLRSREPI
jgi:cobalamin-dependent methionine synthase I